MSSSISLGTSADLESLTSDIKDQFQAVSAAAHKEPYGREFIYSDIRGSTTPVCNIKWPNKGGSIRRTQHSRASQTVVDERGANKDFYQQVDERMSRNSVEYPEQQAKYVGKWLDDMELSRSKSIDYESTRDLGNIVGIRGFPVYTDKESQRANYNKLKFNYSKLQSDYNKVMVILDETRLQFEKSLRKKDYDIELLKALIGRARNRRQVEKGSQKACDCETRLKHKSVQSDPEVARLRHQLSELEFMLSAKNREHELLVDGLRKENGALENLTNQSKEEFERELDRLKSQIRNLSLQPENKLLLALSNENCRLKESSQLDFVEFQALKDSYRNIESRIRSMIEDQEFLEKDKNEEIGRIMVELCRLQVYQPKLEMTLDNERKIKVELQGRIENLEGENDRLREQLNDQMLELNNARMRSKMYETTEIERLSAEVVRWQEKFHRLKREKSDMESMLSSLRSKLDLLDARHKSEINQVKEADHCELERMGERLKAAADEKDRLKCKLVEMEARLSEAESDRQRAFNEFVEIEKKLQTRLANERTRDSIERRLKESEEQVAALISQLNEARLKLREALDDKEACEKQLELSKHHVDQLQQRFRLQQNAYDELKEKKDKELAKLRVDLNFEKYNRQVALKGIEKELRVSLKELETMKHRFSSRLA